MRVHTWGPWNIEEIRRYGQSFAACAEQLAGAPWGVLAFIHGEAIHTPESHQGMVEAIKVQRSTGRCATAVLLQVDIYPDLVRGLLNRMYSEAGEPCAFFDDPDAARTWLLARIDSATSAREDAG